MSERRMWRPCCSTMGRWFCVDSTDEMDADTCPYGPNSRYVFPKGTEPSDYLPDEGAAQMYCDLMNAKREKRRAA